MSFVKPAAAAAVLLAAACASDPFASHPANVEIQHEITTIVQRVRIETGAALYDDLKRLVAYDVFAVKQVSELAEDDNARVRGNALFVLAQIRDPDHPDVMKRIEKVLARGLDDSEPAVRLEAASGLALRGKWEVLPVLIGGLESSDSGIRFRCHEQLLATTSQDFGFSVDASAEERKQAVERWRSFFADWKKSRG